MLSSSVEGREKEPPGRQNSEPHLSHSPTLLSGQNLYSSFLTGPHEVLVFRSDLRIAYNYGTKEYTI